MYGKLQAEFVRRAKIAVSMPSTWAQMTTGLEAMRNVGASVELPPPGTLLPDTSTLLAPAARPLAPAARPLAPAARPLAPAARSLAPAARPLAPAARSLAPAARPLAPAARPLAPAARPPTTTSSSSNSNSTSSSPSEVMLPSPSKRQKTDTSLISLAGLQSSVQLAEKEAAAPPIPIPRIRFAKSLTDCEPLISPAPAASSSDSFRALRPASRKHVQARAATVVGILKVVRARRSAGTLSLGGDFKLRVLWRDRNTPSNIDVSAIVLVGGQLPGMLTQGVEKHIQAEVNPGEKSAMRAWWEATLAVNTVDKI
jgi:hypothetical protein